MHAQRIHRGVLVAVDGSATSDAAVRWAAQEASMRNLAMTIVHVLPQPAASWSALAITTAPLPDEIGQSQQHDGQWILDEAVSIARNAAPLHDGSITTQLLSALLIPTLLELTKHAELAVVGSVGKSALRRVMLGSVSTALVHHARCPVAVIRGEELAADQQWRQRTVLVGVDGSPASDLALAIAFEEASFRGVPLVALHAASDVDMSVFPGIDRSAVRSAAEETLAEGLAGWPERYPDVTIRRVIVDDRPAQHLLAQSESAQLLVVGSRGRGGFTGMLLGSVSTAIVHAAAIPVIVARQY